MARKLETGGGRSQNGKNSIFTWFRTGLGAGPARLGQGHAQPGMGVEEGAEAKAEES